MKLLINYANAHFKKAQKFQSWTGRYVAHFDKIYEFGPDDVDETFRQEHSRIFQYERGNGLWLWKPYFINKVISMSNDGDIIFYVDSGAFFIRNPRELYSYLTNEQPIFVTDIPLIESCWTKPSCFEQMGCSQWKDTNQIQGSFILLLVNKFTRDFFSKWLQLCADTDMLIPEGLGKFDIPERNYGTEFVAHREDQSVFSLWCKRNGIMPHRDYSQRGMNPKSYYSPNYAHRLPEHPNDNYKTIVYLHKSPSLGQFLKNRIKSIIKKMLVKN